MRKAILLASVLALSLAFATTAYAADGSTLPHGGFSTSSDSCLQCHDIHEAAGDYALMRQSTITATCGSCHTLYQVAPTGAYNPGYSGTEAGTAAGAEAYKVPFAARTTHNGHRLGLGTGTYTFADGASGTGSYIPGGTQALTAIKYLSYPDTVSATSFTAVNGLNCASCHTPHGTFGNMVPAGVSTALLTSKPNHTANAVTMADWTNDGGQWCASCHDKRAPGADLNGTTHSNHPDVACLTCHGAEPSAATPDFPHTGLSNLVSQEPDALCLNCHVSGLLP